MIMRLPLSLYLLFGSIEVVAFPGGAGSCSSGIQAIETPGSPHFPAPGNGEIVGTGPIGDNGYLLKIDGETLSESSDFSLDATTEHTITLESTPDMDDFRGFLLRLQNNAGPSTIGMLIPPGGMQGPVVHNSFRCTDEFSVGSLTHFNGRVDKRMISGTLDLDDEAGTYTLDVTVVTSTASGGLAEWYFSTYTLIGTPSDEESPTFAPSLTTAPPSLSCNREGTTCDMHSDCCSNNCLASKDPKVCGKEKPAVCDSKITEKLIDQDGEFGGAGGSIAKDCPTG